MALNTPTVERVAEIADRLRERIDNSRVVPGSLWNDAETLDVVVRLWLGDEERGLLLFAELREIAGHTAHWNAVDIKREFSADRFMRLARLRAKKEEAESPTPARVPQGIPTLDAVMPEMNKEFVHTFIGASDMVMRIADLVPWKPRSFTALHNDPVRTVNKDGEIVLVGRGAAWLDRTDRTVALDGVVCEPEQPSGIIRSGLNSEHFQLNTWQGAQLVPQEGDWSPMREVLEHVFPEKPMCEWAIKWLARTVQFPWLRGETALVLTGPHGAGKSTIVEFLKRVFPPRHCAIVDDPQRVFGRFNDHLRDLVVLVAEEAFFHGEPRNFNKLKNRITGDMLSLEIKNGAVFQAINRISNIIISNDDFVVQTAHGDRRYAVSKALLWKQNDNIHWTAFYHFMDNGGWAAFYHYLLNLDLSDFNHRLPPETEALRDQRRFTRATTPEAWLQEVLERGFWVRSVHGHVEEMHVWPDKVGKQWLKLSQKQWARDHGFQRHEILNSWQIGDLMRKVTGHIHQRLTYVPVSENTGNDGGVQYQHREWGWELPDLNEMRQWFEEHVGDSIDWLGRLLDAEPQSDATNDVPHDQHGYDEEPEGQ